MGAITTRPVVILSDNDGHKYAVPFELRGGFSEWLEAMENGEEWDGEDYERYTLNFHLSGYVFHFAHEFESEFVYPKVDEKA